MRLKIPSGDGRSYFHYDDLTNVLEHVEPGMTVLRMTTPSAAHDICKGLCNLSYTNPYIHHSLSSSNPMPSAPQSVPPVPQHVPSVAAHVIASGMITPGHIAPSPSSMELLDKYLEGLRGKVRALPGAYARGYEAALKDVTEAMEAFK